MSKAFLYSFFFISIFLNFNFNAFAFIDSTTSDRVHNFQAINNNEINNNSIFEDRKETEEDYYNSVLFEFSTKSYKDAIDDIINLRRKFPFSKYNEKMYQMQVFLLYLREDYEKVEELTDQFYTRFPRSENMAYMIYMKSLALSKIPKDHQRQKGVIQDALKFSQYIIKNYPNTVYAIEAEKNSQTLRESLMKNEIMIADFYFNDKYYISAASRYSNFIEEYGRFNLKQKEYAEIQLQRLIKLFTAGEF